MKAFIDEYRDAYGVGPICRVLPIAPSTYHVHAARRADPSKPCDLVRRRIDDDVLDNPVHACSLHGAGRTIIRTACHIVAAARPPLLTSAVGDHPARR
jgi:hypothetical protein